MDLTFPMRLWCTMRRFPIRVYFNVTLRALPGQVILIAWFLGKSNPRHLWNIYIPIITGMGSYQGWWVTKHKKVYLHCISDTV